MMIASRPVLSIFGVVAVLGLLTGCDDLLLGHEGTFTANCDRDPPLTYDNFGAAYMGKWCVGCHSSLVRENQRSGATIGVDFDTYADIVRQVERIDARGVQTDGMPPGGGASEAETAKFGEWLRCQVYADAKDQGSGS